MCTKLYLYTKQCFILLRDWHYLIQQYLHYEDEDATLTMGSMDFSSFR